MDNLSKYRQIIINVIHDYARYPYSYGKLERQVVLDNERDHYLLMTVGWHKGRAHACLIHVDIIEGKFWIQRDGTEDGVATQLEAAGVPKSDIVLAFQPPDVRPLTDYAVA